jgi:fluoride exporter
MAARNGRTVHRRAGSPRGPSSRTSSGRPSPSSRANRCQAGPVSVRPWDPRRLLVIAAGGVVGAGARWAVLAALPDAPGFPWPVLAVNVVGCWLVGIVIALADERVRAAPLLRDGGAIGFCGGFTTFSTFAVQVARLADDDRGATAAAYVVASVALGVTAVVAGAAVARRGRTGPPLTAPS